jgi:large subunit ribosomal protein L18
MIKKPSRNELRLVRHKRIRENLTGTSERPRLCVFRSNANIEAQIIDDTKQTTLVSASTLEKDLEIKNGGNVEAAKLIGAEIASRAKKAKITKVVFDRGGYLYHGRVKALAEAARENGLEF